MWKAECLRSLLAHIKPESDLSVPLVHHNYSDTPVGVLESRR
jgi:hypothetical protein